MNCAKPLSSDRLIRINEVVTKSGLAIPTIYRHMSEGRFPRQTRIGRAAAWSEREIDAWITARLADRAA